MSEEKKFPNGFTSWMETHFEIVSAIAIQRAHDTAAWTPMIKRINDTQGTGGFYELAEALTDKFEEATKDHVWDDADYFDTIDNFIKEEFNKMEVGDEYNDQIDMIESILEQHSDNAENFTFTNYYACPSCKHRWHDQWSAQCDDDCPSCGKRHISPFFSEDVKP